MLKSLGLRPLRIRWRRCLRTRRCPTGLLNMTAAMQERLRTIGPQTMATTLSRLPDSLRQQIEASLGRTTAAMASGHGGDDILKLMQKHLARRAEPSAGQREVLSLEKAWHGVHYLLAGTAEPGPELRSQAVLGGVELGDDPGASPATARRATSARFTCAS